MLGQMMNKGLKPLPALIALVLLPQARAADTADEDPDACNCSTLEVSAEEAANGCPAHVKERVCPLYRDVQQWRERLQLQRDRRRLEKRMEPSNIPRSR